MLVEKNRLNSDNPQAHLFQVDISGAPAPYRVTDYDQDLAFHGFVYFRAPLAVDTLEEPTHASLVNLRVTLENITKEAIALLENYWVFASDPQWQCTIWTIFALTPDEMPYQNGEVFSVQQVTTDFMVGIFDLVAEGVTLSALLPKRRYTASNGYVGIPRK